MAVPRRAAGAAALGDTIYVVGGHDGSGPTAAVEAYDTIADRWTPVAPLPRALSAVAVAAAGGTLLAAGGLDAGGAAVADVWAYDPAADAWTARAPLPRPRGAAGATFYQGAVRVVGGLRDGASLRELATYDAAADAWIEGPPMGNVRHGLGVAATNLLLYAVGGADGDTALTVGEAFEAASAQWFKEVAPLPLPRAGLALVTLRGLLHAFGGSAGDGVTGAVDTFDPPRNSWAPEPDMPTRRREAAAVAAGARVYVIGGATAAGEPTAVTEVFLPAPTAALAGVRVAVARRRARLRLRAVLPDAAADPAGATLRVAVRDGATDVVALALPAGALVPNRRATRWKARPGTLPARTKLRLRRAGSGLRLRLVTRPSQLPAAPGALAVRVELREEAFHGGVGNAASGLR